MSTDPPPPYLLPYLRAAAVHGPGFGSLLWASPDTQAVRFEAFTRMWDFDGQSVLDVGCGRADLLDYLLSRGTPPADYIGIEAVTNLADEAQRKGTTYARGLGAGGTAVRIIRADFVQEPARMFVAADVVVFSGSLNTMPDPTFYATLRRAYEATAHGLAFNFLDGPTLAGNSYLCWRRRDEVLRFARELVGQSDAGRDGHVDGGRVRCLADYLEGDCTVGITKPPDGVSH